MIGGFQPVAFQTNFQQEATSSGAGKKTKRRRYLVTVDGQDFEVQSAEYAREILERAAELATKAAQAEAEVVYQKVSKPKKIELTPPKVSTSAPIDVTPYREAIQQAYKQAAIDAELMLYLELQAQDEEAAAYLLLH